MDRTNDVLKRAEAKLASFQQPQGGAIPPVQKVPAPPMSVQPAAKGLLDFVGQNQPQTYVPFAPGTPTLAGKQFREQQRQFNIGVADDVSKRYGVAVSPRESYDNVMAQIPKGLKPLEVQRDERNYNRGVLESDRNYNRGVDRDKEMDARYYDERDYNRTWNEDERGYQREKDDIDFLRSEAAGLREAVLSGGLNADQAIAQIQTDIQNGFYTPEQAQVLQNIAGGMKTYGDTQKRAQMDVALSGMTPKNSSPEEAKAAIAKLGIFSPSELLEVNKEIDTMWEEQKPAPGILQRATQHVTDTAGQHISNLPQMQGVKGLNWLVEKYLNFMGKDQP